MRDLLPVVCLALATAASAERGAMSAKQLGAGGGYTHPSAEAGDYLENGPRRPAPPAAPAAKAPPVAPAAPARPPTATAQAATQTATPAARETTAAASVEAKAPTPSLWNGLVRPLPAAAPDAGDEAAGADAARRYDGQAEAPALALTPGPSARVEDAAVPAASPRNDALFVSIELDPGEAGTLRDAVAGLGATGFSPDPRFEARPGGGRASIVTGWLPAARLGDAVTRPGVRRVSVETAARPAAREVEIDGAFLLGLRVPDPARPAESVSPALAALARDAGLRGARVLGLETAPDGRMVAVVSGRLPLARLSKALMRSDVVKLVPAPAPEPLAPAAAPAAPAPAPTPEGFARFMARQGLWLVVLTLTVALVLPGLRGGITRGLKALVPYH